MMENFNINDKNVREEAKEKLKNISNYKIEDVEKITESKHIVAYEPTSNLDKQTEILDILKKLAPEEGKCLIIVTHSQNICDLKKVK